MSHTDPFILKEDVCSGCQEYLKSIRIPCLTCMGSASYCSDQCMSRNYHAHNFECSQIMRRVVQSNGSFFNRRWQQCGAQKGLPLLLRQLAQSINSEESRKSIYLIRLPTNPTLKLTPNHPIKKVNRGEWREMAMKSVCFEALWRAFIRLASDNAERLFVICYAPDLSFGTVIVVGEPPIVQQVICPCSVHSKT